jgi:hypothetical protein
MDKIDALMDRISSCLDAGRYLDTRHSIERQREREITRVEVIYVLRHGFHERKKDKFEALHQAWNYAIRGKTVDGRDLRVIVSFDDSDMLIITAIDLEV